MEFYLIARSQEKESMNEPGTYWYREYAMRRMSSHVNWEVVARYMTRIDNKHYARIDGKVAIFTNPDATWEMWAEHWNPMDAINDVIGDSAFFAATSIHPFHAQAVERLQKQREVVAIERAASDRLQRASAALIEWKREQQRAFDKRNKHKSAEQIAKAIARTKARLQPEHDRLLAAEQEARAAFMSITQSA